MGNVTIERHEQSPLHQQLDQELSRTTQAVAGVRSMRGCSQAKLLLCKDGEHYVVKFANNPQHRRVLINEWLATHLARSIGLSVPPCKIVHVDEDLARKDRILEFDLPRREHRSCASGPQFGSLFTSGALEYLPSEAIPQTSNTAEFAGILCLDKWTSNQDSRQVLFTRQEKGGYRAVFIDHGFCFGAAEWILRNEPLRSIYAHRVVYSTIQGWSDFEPWLSRIEDLKDETLRTIAESIPPSWFSDDHEEFSQLLDKLLLRKKLLRTLLYECGTVGQVFPKWLSYAARE